MRRPESARLKIPGRDSLFTRGAGEEATKYSQANDVHHTPVKEAQEQEEDCPDGDADEQKSGTHNLEENSINDSKEEQNELLDESEVKV